MLRTDGLITISVNHKALTLITKLLVALLTGVGVSDLIGLVGIQPDLLLPAAQDAGGQPLLEPEHAAGRTHNSRLVLMLRLNTSLCVHKPTPHVKLNGNIVMW